jgi:hypothetical protein
VVYSGPSDVVASHRNLLLCGAYLHRGQC